MKMGQFVGRFWKPVLHTLPMSNAPVALRPGEGFALVSRHKAGSHKSWRSQLGYTCPAQRSGAMLERALSRKGRVAAPESHGCCKGPLMHPVFPATFA